MCVLREIPVPLSRNVLRGSAKFPIKRGVGDCGICGIFDSTHSCSGPRLSALRNEGVVEYNLIIVTTSQAVGNKDNQ